MTDLDILAPPTLTRDEITHRALALCADSRLHHLSRHRIGDTWQLRINGLPVTARRLTWPLTALEQAGLIRWCKPQHTPAHVEHVTATDTGRGQLMAWDAALFGGDA